MEEPGPLWAKTDGAEETPVVCEMSMEHPEIVSPAVTLQSFCSLASRCRQFATFGSVPARGQLLAPLPPSSHATGFLWPGLSLSCNVQASFLAQALQGG